MVKLSKRDLQIIAGVIGAADFYYEGALTAPVSRAVKKAISAGAARMFLNPGQVPTMGAIGKEIGKGALRAAPRVAGTGLAIGRTIALRHPYIAAGAVIYVAVKNREQIADLIREGYDVVQEAIPEPTPFASQFSADPFGASAELIRSRPRIPGRLMPKKRRSAYNSAVSKGIKALKKSTSYGKRGVLNTPKKAFGFVARTVSKLRKGKKVPSKGASGVVKRSLGNIKITVRKP